MEKNNSDTYKLFQHTTFCVEILQLIVSRFDPVR